MSATELRPESRMIIEYQCQCCGAVSPNPDGSGYCDGSNPQRNARGVKVLQREAWEDRAGAHREWRYRQRLGVGADVDLIEWLRWQERLEPVVALELTLVPGEMPLPGSYLSDISYRFRRQVQGEAAREVARRLGVPLYIVAFRANMQEFWVYEGLERELGQWHTYTEPEYLAWLHAQYQRCRTELEAGERISS